MRDLPAQGRGVLQAAGRERAMRSAFSAQGSGDATGSPGYAERPEAQCRLGLLLEDTARGSRVRQAWRAIVSGSVTVLLLAVLGAMALIGTVTLRRADRLMRARGCRVLLCLLICSGLLPQAADGLAQVPQRLR